MKKLAFAAAAALLLGGIVYAGTTIKPFRASGGVQMVPTGVWNGQPDMGGFWYKADAGGMVHNPNNTDTLVGSGGASFPLTNGTSTNTYTSAVSDGASAVAHEFNTTNAFSTDGDYVMRVRSNSVDWFTMGRASSQNAFTFTGNSNGSGTGPVIIKSTSGGSGLTLDATAAGGRIYQHYSTILGTWVLADITAGQNRWQMDANGALAPFSNNTVNLGLPGTNEMAAVYSVLVTTSGAITTNIASVSGQQASIQAIATTAAVSAGTMSNSPGAFFRSQAWNSGSSAGQPMDWMIQAIPTSGNPVTGQLSIYSNPNSAGWTERFRVTPTRATALNGMVVTSGFGANYRTSATTVTVAITDHFVGVTGTGARTVNLPAANTCLAAGQEIVVQEIGNDAGTITINRAGSDTINGATSITIATAYGRKTLFCNASNAWFASSATN